MTEPKYVTLPSNEKIQTAIDVYALAVGRVSGAWNFLHQTLGGLFAVIIGGDHELLLTAWRSIENDRAQREMLCATIKAASPERWKQTPKAPADLLWVLGRAETLSKVRNDAIHALVGLYFVGAENVEINVARPARGRREKRLLANAVKGRKLLDEFAKCQQDVDALSIFVRQATGALAGPQEWPTPQPKQMWVSPS
jgi:hypothetical protein